MGYTIHENSAYAGKSPRLLTPSCHDRTPFITIRCDCRQEMHVHESQLADVPTRKFGTTCLRCLQIIVVTKPEMERAFAHMREQGWIR